MARLKQAGKEPNFETVSANSCKFQTQNNIAAIHKIIIIIIITQLLIITVHYSLPSGI